MKILGIDYGSKRIGIAMTDESGFFALPYDMFINNTNVIGTIVVLCKKNDIQKIIIGRSVNYKMKENPIMVDIKKFADRLKREVTAQILFEDESLTTQEASRIQGDIKKIDASAAALILKSYIDKQENR